MSTRPTRPTRSAPTGRRPRMRILVGLAVSPGVAIGPALALDPRGRNLPARTITSDAVAAELERLDEGLHAAAAEARAAEAAARRRLGPQYAQILGAHARLVADAGLRRQARERIERAQLAAEHAICEVLDALAAKLEGLADSHLAARAADVRDIEERILAQLAGSGAVASPLDDLSEPTVVLAHDLSPSQTAGLDPARVLGFATEAGGRTSHTAIVAAGLEIPAVVGLGPFLERARTCQRAILDGDEGLLILDPDAATLKRYRHDAATRAARFRELANQSNHPAVTRDGIRIHLAGNIEFPGEAAACKARGAEAIGLYRTEFLYLGESRPPTEDEQFHAYQAVVRSLPDRPIVIRTLDLGADKVPGYSTGGSGPGRNPFLGLRSIRLSLRQPELFRAQLRAILRVSTLGDVRVLFPLVATLDELRRAKALLRDVAEELIDEGVPVRPDLPIGAMIEVPSAALIADVLAREVSFFSIGTNDLIQYTLAVDRADETVADLYDAADPAVLRLIRQVVQAAEAHRIEVNVCGSMGGDPLYTMLLLGLGLRELSMPPHQIPQVKQVVRAVSLAEAEALAAEALTLDTAAAVAARLKAELQRVAPEALIQTSLPRRREP